jgi:hypothetical protein
MKEFEIKSPLLYAAIFGDLECYHINGYLNTDTGDYGRALIEYFAARRFGIHRIPGFEPHYLKGSLFGFQRKFGNLSEEEFKGAYKEFCDLYEFTQNELKNSDKVVDGKVKVNRSLRSFETEEIVPQILKGEKMIEFPVNILSSYAHDGIYNCYGSWMSLYREVSVEQVIMYNECLSFPWDYCRQHKMNGGESEVWVVETDIFGYTKLPVECFKYSSIPESARKDANERMQHEWIRNVAPVREGSLIKSALPNIPLLCKRTKRIERLIQREIDKDEEFWEKHGR